MGDFMATRVWAYNVWAECVANAISPDVSGEIEVKIASGSWLKLIDSSAGAGRNQRLLVLCHPGAGRLSQVFKLCQQQQIAVAFRLSDAFEYDRVFAIGAFAQADLDLLGSSETVVEIVSGRTAQELAEDLRAKLP
jgi:hypothetical protein